MADEIEQNPNDHTRDFIRVTPRQAIGWGGGVMAVGSLLFALNTIKPLKEFAFTREEGVALERRISAVEIAQKEITLKVDAIQKDIVQLGESQDRKLNDIRKELSEQIERSSDRVIARLSEVTNRLHEKIDRQEERLGRELNETKRRSSK